MIIEAKNLTRVYARGAEKIAALDGATFAIERGQIVSVVGPSGSGKTTLVNVLGCLDNPTSGKLAIDGRTVFHDGVTLSESDLTLVRRKYFGYVFQKFFLIPTLTVRENILLPAVFQKKLKANEKNLPRVLETLGIAGRADHLPAQLSGGEMQRVAIARALINEPPVLIADEPTGNLDSKRSDEIRGLLLRLNRDHGLTVIVVTHNPDLAKIGHRTLELLDGRLTNR